MAAGMKEKLQTPAQKGQEWQGPQGAGVRTLVQGYGLRSGEEGHVGPGFQYSFLLAILEEQGTRIDTASMAVSRGRSGTPQGELSKEGERMVGGLQTVTVPYSDFCLWCRYLQDVALPPWGRLLYRRNHWKPGRGPDLVPRAAVPSAHLWGAHMAGTGHAW